MIRQVTSILTLCSKWPHIYAAPARLCEKSFSLRRTLVVEGTLVGPWIAELGTTWRNASQDLDRRKLVIDLKNMTVVSREGEEAIFDLMKKGAKFSCGGAASQERRPEIVAPIRRTMNWFSRRLHRTCTA